MAWLRNRLRQVTKSSIAYLAYFSGMIDELAAARTGIRNQPRIIILGYHRLVENFQESSKIAIPSLLTSVATFRRQLDLMLKKFDCITLDDAIEAIAGRLKLSRDAVVLTFDDGYRDFYDLALPTLRSYKLPSAIFVATDLIGGNEPLIHDQVYYLICELSRRHRPLPHLPPLPAIASIQATARKAISNGDNYQAMRALLELPRAQLQTLIDEIKCDLNFTNDQFPDEYKMLTWPMLREIAAANITIGAHTCNHLLLTLENVEKVTLEIANSKRALEEGLNLSIDHFAYPDGRYNDQVIGIVRAAGFRSASTIEDRPNTLSDDPYRLKRKILWENSCLGIFGGYSDIVAECQLRGLFSNPAYKLRLSSDQHS
jgi:peptidoglycan/xylan/chitin deacetylase (PgdA/CDA1 family)